MNHPMAPICTSASRRRRSRDRRGVVLLLVVTLLVMFLLIGVTGVIVATTFHTSSKASSRQARTEVRYEDFGDRIMMQLLRGADMRSSLWGHDLLGDLYGTDSIVGTVQTGAVDAATSGQFLMVDVIFPTATQTFPVPDQFVGRVFTFLEGPNAGRSTRITRFELFPPDQMGAIYNGTATPNTVTYRIGIDRRGGLIDFGVPAQLVGNRFLINGAPFNGTGVGYKTSPSIDTNGDPIPDDPSTLFTLNQTVPFDHDGDPSTPATQIHTYLLPNFRTYEPNWPAPDAGGLDEPYDSVSLQDMPLAWVPSNVSATTPVIPSFYRYQHIRYLRDRIFTDDPTLDAESIDEEDSLPFIHTPYAQLSPRQRFAFWNVLLRAVMRPLAIPDQTAFPLAPPIANHRNFTGGNPAFLMDPTETPYQYLSRLAGDTSMLAGVPLPLDADTDGDQVPDAIWIDPGLPVQTARDGRRYKILAAIQVRDLNAHLNVNAMTSGPVIGNVLRRPEETDPLLAMRLSVTMPVGRGSGYGPAEITPLNTPTGQDIPLLTDTPPLIVGAIPPPPTPPVLGRYGDEPLNAVPGAPAATRLATDATNLIPKLKAPGPYPQLDLLGLGQLGFDLDGQPVHVFQALSYLQPYARPEFSPYAFDPLRRNQKYDAPFTEAEIERMLRKYDVDGSVNPGRLQVLASTTAFGPNPQDLRALTSISVHIPQPGHLPPPELRRTGTLPVGTTYYSQLFARAFSRILDMLVQGDLTNTNSTMDQKILTARNSVKLMVPFEVRHGFPMNVNRPFGNGVDDNGNGEIDEIAWNGVTAVPEDLGARAFVDFHRPVDGVGGHSIRDDFPQYGQAPSDFTNGEPALGNGRVIDPRVLYARHLYCTVAFSMPRSNNNPHVLPYPPDTSLYDTMRRIAQWAINCAEFRDPDGIMTAFEFDYNPWDGWDVNGDPLTMVDPTTGATVPGVEPYAGLVWGCEQPELLLTESLLMHDRRVADTANDPSGRTRSSMSMPDEDLDQVKFPQASLFFELYCPRPKPNAGPVNLVQYGQFPPELYNVNAATGLAALALDRMAPPQPGLPQTARPVWRIAISDVLVDRDEAADRPPHPVEYVEDAEIAHRDHVTYQPEEMIPRYPGIPAAPELNIPIEREVWFANVDPVATLGMTHEQAQRIFFNRYASSTQLTPGSYLVVGPRTVTRIGSESQQVIRFQDPSGFPVNNRDPDDLEVIVTDTTGTKSGGQLPPVATNISTGFGNVQPMQFIVCASHLPSNWDSENKTSLVVAWDADNEPLVKGVGLNATLPLAEMSVLDPTRTYWAPEHEPDTIDEELVDAGGNPVPRDVPLDEDENTGSLLLDSILVEGAPSTGTYLNYKAAFLQRLANPLLPWNPIPGEDGHNANLPLNPYITVDWMSLDLHLFNGEDSEPEDFSGTGPWDPFDAASEDGGDDDDEEEGLVVRFGTRQKGFQSESAPFRNPMPWTFESTPPEESEEAEDADGHFPYDLVHTLGFLNDTFSHPSVPWPRNGNLDVNIARMYNGSPTRPFPWLSWNNRPYHSPGEVLLVPATSPGRLFHEYGDIARVASENESTTGPYQPSNLTLLRSVSGDYNTTGGLDFPNGGYLPFPHLLNFFHTSKALMVSGTAATYGLQAPDFSRVLDLLGMPGPFMGAEEWYNPTSFAAAGANTMADGYRPPFNYLPNFRDAGRLNLNTLGDYYDLSDGPPVPPQTAVWNALTANMPFDPLTNTGSPSFQEFNQARRGTGTGINLMTNAQTPELINNPFRPANAADLMPNFNLPITGINGDTPWGGANLSQLGASEVGLLRRDAAGTDPNRPLFHLRTLPNVPANPATRLHAMNRLFNLTTNQANCYAVWISLGKFEVEYDPSAVGSRLVPDGYILGQELGFEDGTQQRHRSFFIIDRSVPVGYEPGKNHNTTECVLLRRFLE